MAVASNSQNLIDDFKDQLTTTVKVKLLRKLTSFIGWNLSFTSEGIYVSQSKIEPKVLPNHNLSHVQCVSTPLPLSADVSFQHSNESYLSTADYHRYCSIVGSLEYLAVCKRLNISFAISVLSKQLQAATLRHLTLVRRVVQYISETRKQSIFFFPFSRAPLTTSADSDWFGCHERRRSTTSIIITFNEASSFWQSKRQTLEDLYSQKVVAFKHMPTFEQPADMLTKPLIAVVLSNLTRLINV